MTTTRFAWILWLGLVAMTAFPGTGLAKGGAARPAKWAQPITGRPGLSNFFRVTPTLYRGAQPEPEGFASLKALGITTVLNLRSLHSDRARTKATGLRYVHLRTTAWHVEDDEVIRFLRLATDPETGPLFVHCQHGADRTGTMIAAYRIVIQDWPKEDAIAEMTKGGYGFHAIWKNLVPYVRALDVQKIKHALAGHGK